MVQFRQSMDLTGFSDLRGSLPAWTLNVFAFMLVVLMETLSCLILANKSVSVAYAQCQYPDEYCTSEETGNQAASFDQLITYFGKYNETNMMRNQKCTTQQ